MSALLILILGCAGGDGGGGKDADDSASDTGSLTGTDAYLADNDEQPPVVDLDAVGDDLTAVFDGFWKYNTVPVFDVYETLIAEATSECPNITTQNNSAFWSASGCMTPDGTTFQGYMNYYSTGVGRGLSGSATITSPDGTLVLNGEYFYSRQDSTSNKSWQSTIDASTSWDGAWPASTWLSDGQDSRLSISAYQDRMTGARVSLAGRVLGLGSEVVEAVVFNGESVIYEEKSCPGELVGELSVLVDGVWVDLFFNCGSSCASAWSQGFSLGEVCTDATGLMGWVEADVAPF